MSLKVLVIPEDHTWNGYILRPLLSAIFSDIGRRNAKIHILTSPRVTGYTQARDAIREELVEKYRHFDLWLFIPDADRASPDAMQSLEAELQEKGITLLCSPAQPEVEIYACIAHRDQLSDHWTMVREAHNMKEAYFEPLLERMGNPRAAGAGRDQLIRASISNMQTLYQFCPELELLRQRIRSFLDNHPTF